MIWLWIYRFAAIGIFCILSYACWRTIQRIARTVKKIRKIRKEVRKLKETNNGISKRL